MTDTKRVLMIAYAFPPAGGSGVQRAAKFAKYLPEFGWRPTVWSAAAPGDLPRDESLRAELPRDLDHRIHDRFDASRWVERAARWATRIVHTALRSERLAAALGWRVRRLLRGCVLHGLAPDASVLWALSSVRAVRRIVEREGIDVIYSTYSPASNHLLAWLVSRATGTPWVADFRDLWTQDFRYPFARGPWWRRAIDRRLERRILERADAVIAVTQPQAELLASLVPEGRAKFSTIPNGVDLADFPTSTARREHGSGPSPRRNAFRLSYVGRFCSGTIAPAFFEALAQVRVSLGADAERFELRLVGQISTALRERLEAWNGCWSSTGYVPHREAIREMMDADVLLLGVAEGPHSETIMTGKVFEYLAAGRPILVMGPEHSVAAKLVTECGAGVISAPRPEALSAVMMQFWRQWSEETLPAGCARRCVGPYTRRNLTGRLAAVLNALSTRGEIVKEKAGWCESCSEDRAPVRAATVRERF